MLRWLSSLTDQRPLGSVSGAKKFVASLDRDIFAASDKVSDTLRSYSAEIDGTDSVDPTPLVELDQMLAESTARLERDFLAASSQAHSLRNRLWESGYEWAMRFADAYRLILQSVQGNPNPKFASAYARAAIGLVSFRAMGYRYRLYRHEEWIPGNWRELNAQFRQICELGLDHRTIPDPASGIPNDPARMFVALLLLRLGNAGSYMPVQTRQLWEKLIEHSFDARLTARPAAEGGFVVDLSGSDGLQPRHSVPQGGHFLFRDTSTIYQRLMSWLDQAQRDTSGSTATQGNSMTASINALRSAVLRIDPEFKPLERASQRNTDQGRLAAVYGLQRSAIAVAYEPNILLPTLEGESYGYADAHEIQTLGLLRESTMKRLKKDLPPEVSKVNLQYWHLRDKSDTGYRCVMANAPGQDIRLRDITVVCEEGAQTVWQVAMIVRLLKLPAGHIELGLQVLTRDADSVELKTIRSKSNLYGAPTTLSTSAPFKALRLKGAFFGRPIMDASWIMAITDYSAGAVYESVGTSRKYEANTVIAEGSDWIWVQPTEIMRQDK
ncbi:MAG: hypothetical protein ACRDAM_06655 [Casimicrobium sp.]